MVNENTRNIPAWYRRQILREQNGFCAGKTCTKHAELDWKECETNHIFPWHKGGRTVRWNLEVLCITCHKKHTRADARARMPKKQKKPKTHVVYEKQYSNLRLSPEEKAFIMTF
jgi:5-methylcytosine-specific restriction endonuclease McrA